VQEPDAASLPVLVLEDRPELRLLYQRYLHQSEFRMVPATSVAEAEALWRNGEPCAVILDLLLDGKDAWHWLVQLKNDALRRASSSSPTDDKGKAMGLGADAYFKKPVGAMNCWPPCARWWIRAGHETKSAHLRSITEQTRHPAALPSTSSAMSHPEQLILNVDDTDAARYARTRILTKAGLRVVEAASGTEAMALARELKPALILLDVKLPDIHGMEVCARLKADPATAFILVLQTSASYIGLADKVRARRRRRQLPVRTDRAD
jgi:DNA-binding response OmpR family regulator